MCKNLGNMENYILKIGLCDDDLNNLNSIVKILESEIIQQDFNAEIILVTDNQNEILDAIKSRKIDILFLDIDFKNGQRNGLELANILRKYNKDFFLIFLTAHQRYMHVSFYTKVFDYLVKPISKDIISEIVYRLKDEFSINKNLFLKLNKWISIRTSDIFYIEKQGNKSIVMTEYGEYTTSKTLDTLLDELPKTFRKSHRSYIVNESKIINVDKKEKYAYFSKDIKCPINSFFEI
jgi:DNA-binding LytR/AlgR family response regulator